MYKIPADITYREAVAIALERAASRLHADTFCAVYRERYPVLGSLRWPTAWRVVKA